MKKSQVLAVVALAFALGVVAPVANTYATVRSDVDPATAAAVQKEVCDIRDEILKIEKIGEYRTLIEQVNGISDIIATNRENAAKAMYADLENDAADYDLTGVNEEDYDAVYTKAINLSQEQLDISQDATSTQQDKQTALARRGRIQGYIFTAKTTLNTNLAAANVTNFENLIKAIQTPITDVTSSQAYKDAGAANDFAAQLSLLIDYAKTLPKYALYVDLDTQVRNVAYVCDGSSNISIADGQTAVKDAQAAIDAFEGKTSTDPKDPTEPTDPTNPDDGNRPGDVVPTDPTKPTVDGNGSGSIGVDAGASFGAPKTGTIAKSEGSASTSVAIMAAISTVVAGLGAAIVAIRNFKRNKNA